ncbi:MAG TPA: 16S rRNA (uracil(1498)-N(3))-methyltransferase [Steroidobacteraceae bacterium]
MRLSRVFVEAPLASGTAAILSGSAANHVVRVLRLRKGHELTLFNGSGGEYAARIESLTGSTVTVSIGEERAVERESPLVLTLAQGISRGERMDLVMQKATELGVTHLVAVLTERSVVRLDAAQAQRKLAHWRAITIAACEQSGRNRPPGVVGPVGLRDLLRSDLKSGTRLLLSPEAKLRVVDVPRPVHSVTVLIGPEGGLTAEEHERAVGAGFLGVRLGPRVLRTETAALAALALLQREFGDL